MKASLSRRTYWQSAVVVAVAVAGLALSRALADDMNRLNRVRSVEVLAGAILGISISR